MNGKKIAVTPSAYSYPLLIKQLLHAPLAQTARQEIVYRDVKRLTPICATGSAGWVALL